MKTLYCITALLLISGSAFARIGETESRIEARYGRPTSGFASPEKTYSYKGFWIMVIFDLGKSGIEVYQKLDSSRMSSVEIQTLLVANGGGETWHNPVLSRNQFCYKEKTRFAIYDLFTNKLSVADCDALDRVSEKNQISEARKMKDF